MYLGELGARHELERVVVGDSALTTVDDGHAPFARGVTTDRRIDRARGRVEVPGYDGVVHLLNRAFLERALHDRVCELRLGDHHRAGCAHVEAVHDALALGGPVAGDAISGRLQVAQDRGAFPTGAGVCGDADRLVDDDDILVVVQDRHIGDRRRLVLGFGDAHLDNVHSTETIRLSRAHAVDEDVSLPRQLRAARARQAEHAGQSSVDPLTHEGVGDGKHTRTH